jgi:hypothetical protein
MAEPAPMLGDDICAWCNKWCAMNSFTNDRYHQIQGDWLDAAPVDPKYAPDEDGIVILQMCDVCYALIQAWDWDCGITIIVFGRRFQFDSLYHMNDL